MSNRKLAVCAICRNEADYVLEWVSFYLSTGFDYIFIYDNVSTDGTSELLAALDNAGTIRRVHWPRKDRIPPQRDAYNHFIENYAARFDYVLICDLDEFLFVDSAGGVNELIDAAEAKFGTVGAIAFPWLIFGSAGETSKRPGLVMDRFRKCGDMVAPEVKTMFNPRCTFNFRTHIADLVAGSYIDSDLRPYVAEADMPIRLVEPRNGLARIHHYYTKSREEWDKRSREPKADRAKIERRRANIFDQHAGYKRSVDEADRHIPSVRAKVLEITGVLASKSSELDRASITLPHVDAVRIFGMVSAIPGDSLPKVRIVADSTFEFEVPTHPTHSTDWLYFTLRRKWKPHIREVSISLVGSQQCHVFSLTAIEEQCSPQHTFDLKGLIERAAPNKVSLLPWPSTPVR